MVSFLTRLHIIQSFHLINVFEIDLKCMLTTLCVTTVKTNLIEIIQNLSISLTIYVIILVWINFHLTFYFILFIMKTSVDAPRQSNSTHGQMVRRSIYKTRGPKHPYLPICW